jgi:alkylation response protein AidB-like acyl-CoA dehydrogenase
MGYRTSNTTEVIFDEVKISKKNLIGEECQGMDIMKKALNYTRPTAGAGAVGNAQYAYECAVDYSKVRETFGKPICKRQGISFMLADMYTKLEAARLMVWHACKCADAGVFDTKLFSAAKTFAADIGMEVTTDAVQILGGYGYSKEYPVEKRMRDAKIYQIFEGTNQIQRMIISSNIIKDQ